MSFTAKEKSDYKPIPEGNAMGQYPRIGDVIPSAVTWLGSADAGPSSSRMVAV